MALAYPLSIAGDITLAASSAINFNGAISAPQLLMTYSGSESGMFGIIDNNGSPLSAGYTLQYTGGSIEVIGAAASFSGSGIWVGTTSSWGSSGNWTDAVNPSNPSGVPGDGSRGNGVDSATFSGSGTQTAIALAPTNPNLQSLALGATNYTFTGGSLTLQGGAAATGTASVTVLSGTSTFDTTTTLNLASSTTINPSAGAQLTIDGALTGSSPITLNGPGTLVLAGSNGFAGGVIVKDGTMLVANTEALADGSNLNVGNNPAAFAAVVPVSEQVLAASPALAPVPEPGTIGLLLAALGMAGFAFGRRSIGGTK